MADFPASKVLDRAHFRLGEYAAAANDLEAGGGRIPPGRREVAGTARWCPTPCTAWAGPCSTRTISPTRRRPSTRWWRSIPSNNLNVRGHYARGLARHQLGKFAEAAADLQAVLAAGGVEQGEKSDARYVLGLCQVGLKKPAEAAATFQALLKEDPKYAAPDKVYYELAWALKHAGQDKEAVDAFAELVKQCPDSPRVAESQFHVGEAAYKAGKFQAAAAPTAAALEKAGKTELGEKAAHKLGWAYYRLDNARRRPANVRLSAGDLAPGPLGGRRRLHGGRVSLQAEEIRRGRRRLRAGEESVVARISRC